MAILVTASIGLIFLTVLYFWNTLRLMIKFWKYGEKIPGPPANPILGNLSLFQGKDTKDLFEMFKNIGNEYQKKGENVMRLQLMGKLYIYPLNGKSLVELIESTTELNKGEDYKFADPWLGGGLIMEGYGDRWKSHRKMLTPTFHFAKLNGYLEVFKEEASIMIDLLQDFENQKIDIFPFLRRCTMDIICQTAMGVKVDAQHNPTHEYVKASDGLMIMTTEYAFNPLMWNKTLFKLLGYQKRFDGYLNTLLGFTKNIIKERKEALLSGEVEKQKSKRMMNFLDLLLDMEESKVLNEEDIRQEVDNFMTAGQETTAVAASWAIWNLAHHPEIQDKVYDEIIQIIGEDGDLEVTKINELSYLDRVLKESKRLFPTVPLVDRTLREDMIIDGYTIPSESIVAIPQLVLHSNPTVFKNPDKFDPDRFLPEQIAQRHAYDYIPFSAGVRNCIGQKFAQLNEKVLMINIIRNFQISPMMAFRDTVPSMESTSKPTNGIPVKLVRRY